MWRVVAGGRWRLGEGGFNTGLFRLGFFWLFCFILIRFASAAGVAYLFIFFSFFGRAEVMAWIRYGVTTLRIGMMMGWPRKNKGIGEDI